MTQDELDVKFARLTRDWRRKRLKGYTAASEVITLLDELWDDVLASQGRTHLDLCARVGDILKDSPLDTTTRRI